MYDLMQPKWNKLCTGYFTFPGLVYSYIENVCTRPTRNLCAFFVLLTKLFFPRFGCEPQSKYPVLHFNSIYVKKELLVVQDFCFGAV